MTAWDVLRSLARAWYLTLAGFAATAFALSMVDSYPGVYWSQANVVFLGPQSERAPNSLEFSSAGLISTAGYVEKIVNAGVEKPTTASPVTLVSRGIRDGHSIDLPDSGGQWSHNFDSAILNVQVTGPTSAIVQERLNTLIDKIRTTTQDIQELDNLGPKNVIRTYVAPDQPKVTYATGGRLSALAGTLALGVGLTAFAAVGLDRMWARRRRAKSPTAQSEKIPELV